MQLLYNRERASQSLPTISQQLECKLEKHRSDSKSSDGGPKPGFMKIVAWALIGCKCNSLHHTFIFGPFSALSTRGNLQTLCQLLKFLQDKLDNVVDLETCSKTRIHLQASVPRQPKTSDILLTLAKHLTKNWQKVTNFAPAGRQRAEVPRQRRVAARSTRRGARCDAALTLRDKSDQIFNSNCNCRF